MNSKARFFFDIKKSGVTWTLSIFLLLLLGLPFVIYQSLAIHAEDESLRLARSFSSAISSIRSYYTKNVASRILESHGQVTLTERYRDLKGGVPIPATLSIELGEILREKSEKADHGSFSFAFVSDMPFLHRDRRPLDAFQQDALRSFRQQKESNEFWLVEEQPDGQTALRLAVPVRMEAGCVACHNSHPDSPMKTWKIGDVRGIQDVSIGLSVLDQGQSSLILGIYLLVFLASGGILFIQSRNNNLSLKTMYEEKLSSEKSLNQKTVELQQKISELALKTTMIDKAPFGIAIAEFYKNDLKLNYVNQSFSNITHYSIDELRGRSFQLLTGEETTGEQIKILKESLNERKTSELDLALHTRTGSLIWVRGLFFPAYDQDNHFQNFIICLSDITTLKSTEEEKIKLAGELQESMKLESLGLTIAGIAHDLNTPIGISITAASHLQIMLKELKEHLANNRLSDLKDGLEDIEDASQLVTNNLNKAATLVASFKKTSADATRTEWHEVNLRAYFETLMTTLSPITKRSNCTINLNCPADLTLYTEPGSLSQIITNLVVNATIHAFKQTQTNRIIDISVQDNNDFIVIRLSDNGLGMTDDIKAKIFIPFFTTSRSSGGSGLGLFSAKRTAESVLNGRLTFESILNQGTIFILELPKKNP